MKFLLVYHGGDVPQEHTEENIEQLWQWIENLREQGVEIAGFAGNGHKTVSQNMISDYEGKVFGVSIIEADSMDAAVSLTSDWPELQYGGKLDIFQEL